MAHSPTPREHELPGGDLAVSSHWVHGVRRATTVPENSRPLYRLLMDVLGDVWVPDLMPADLAVECNDLVGARELASTPERGTAAANRTGYSLGYLRRTCDAIEAHRDRDPVRLIAVGCSGSKYDDDELLPARERYKGAYWSCKRQYGETFGGRNADESAGWRVISAEYGLLHPDREIPEYERTPDDLEGVPVHSEKRLPSGAPVETLLDQWALDVYEGLSEWLTTVVDSIDPRDVDLEVLIGRKYRGPLADRAVFDALRVPGSLTVSFPFQEEDAAQGGNGKQMGWMTDEVEAAVLADGGEHDG